MAILVLTAAFLLITVQYVRTTSVAAAVRFLRFSRLFLAAACLVTMVLVTFHLLLGKEQEVGVIGGVIFVVVGIPLLCAAGWLLAAFYFSVCLNAALLRLYRSSGAIEQEKLAADVLHFVHLMRWLHSLLCRLRGISLLDVLRVTIGSVKRGRS